MLASHYAPRARVELVTPERLAERARELSSQGERVAVLVGRSANDPRGTIASLSPLEGVLVLDLGPSDESAAQHLYAALRQADVDGCSVVLAAPPESVGVGEALADRLTKAAGPR
jgi:L-threonylcarbamoyladenylate synthase